MSNLKMKVFWDLLGIVFLLISNVHHGKVLAMETVYRVSDCPRDEREWQQASNRLNCSDDANNPENRYHCLPAANLTTLLEFCYNKTRPQVVKSLCMVFFEKKHILNHYNCGMFKEGCPNTSYYSDEVYKFTACFEIDPMQHCFKAEALCIPTTRLLPAELDTTLPALFNETNSPTADPTEEKTNYLAIVLPVIIVLIMLILISAFVAWKKRQRMRRRKEIPQVDEKRGLLNTDYFEKIEADIDKFEIDYLLHLPTDTKMHAYPLIAKKLNIPLEILYWNLEDRAKFVRSMKDGNISVFSGRGMVIGCAEAGKTTLVKKLKGERNLNTESTSGIEIHPHVFKLHANESTITVCAEQEKNKGCLCLTPTTLQKSEENETETSFSGNKDVVPNQPNAMSQTLTQLIDKPNVVSSSSEGEPSNLNVIESGENSDIEGIVSQVNQPNHNSAIPEEVTQEDEKCNAKSEQKVDVSDCTASVNTDDLKMLSLLDFAGHSAYYACHHIFFSPRAFFILVVDMTKELESVATEACREKDLIYSNWTYADYVRYWLGSIHTYSSKTAPVILVASHAEPNGADHSEVMSGNFGDILKEDKVLDLNSKCSALAMK